MRAKPKPCPAATKPLTLASPLLKDVHKRILAAREQVARAVDSGLVTLYWHIGRRIRQDILKEKLAEHGAEIVVALLRQLEGEFGRGFNDRDLFRMVRFTEVFPDQRIVSALRIRLGWAHPRMITPMEDELKRDFYAEKDGEAAILREIEAFILELGTDFAFLERQKRLRLDSDDHCFDLW